MGDSTSAPVQHILTHDLVTLRSFLLSFVFYWKAKIYCKYNLKLAISHQRWLTQTKVQGNTLRMDSWKRQVGLLWTAENSCLGTTNTTHSNPFSTRQHKTGAQWWGGVFLFGCIFLVFVLNKEREWRDPTWNAENGTISLLFNSPTVKTFIWSVKNVPPLLEELLLT